MARLLDQLGTSPAMTEIREGVERLLRVVANGGRFPRVLIQGEPGVGKSLLAKAIHDASPRRRRKFESLNCGELSETLAESELFGHLKGAFTGADATRAGVFERASGGVLLLDDIGTLALGTQPRLLQVIQEGEVRPLECDLCQPVAQVAAEAALLGGGQPLKVDVWLIAATNENLAAAVEIPPLRERPEDIRPLALYLLAAACSDSALPPKLLTSEACQVLADYEWPGNARDLYNAMLRTAFQFEGESIDVDLLRRVLAGQPRRHSPKAATREPGTRRPQLPLDRERLLATLESCRWNQYRAAQELGVPRSTLRYQIQRLGLGPRPAPVPTVTTAAISAPPGADSSSAPNGSLRWETRSIAALRVLLLAPAVGVPFQAGPVLGLLTERIEALDGQIVEVSPRGLLALFGVTRMEEVACRAAHVGLGLLKAVKREHQTIAVGLALHCRSCLVGRSGDRGLVSADDLAQIRSDLDTYRSSLEPGALIATAEAVPYLHRRFTLRTQGPAGSPGERPVHHVVGPSRVATATELAPRPFVGRDPDIARLEGFLQRARSGRGQAVWVIGDAGLGKSRLLAEFSRRLDRSAVTCVEGRCQPQLATPSLVVGEMIQELFGIVETDSRSPAEHKVRRGLADLGLDADALAPFLLDLLGFAPRGPRAESSPEAFKMRRSAAVRDAVLAAAAQRPIVLFLEDLHWVDQASEEVISSLVDAIGSARVLLVATYRTGFAPSWLTRSHASQLKLEPLDEDQGVEIVRAVAAGREISDELVAGVLRRADGIPLFLEEFARAAAGDPGLFDRSLPATIRDILMARVDRLASTDRTVLQTASILGGDFPVEALHALTPEIDGLRIEDSLKRLQAAELLREKRATSPRLYSFHHALTQEAVYESLAPDLRRGLHGAVLGTIERWGRGTLERMPEVAARHLTEAGRPEEAIDAWLRAGRGATRRSANADAIGHLQAGLGLLTSLAAGPERRARELQLLLALAHALVATRGYGAVEVENTLARAHDLCQDLGSAPDLFPVLVGLWQCRVIRSEHREADRLAAQMLAMSDKSGQPATACLALLARAVPRFYQGDIPSAIAAFEGAAGRYRECAEELGALDLDQDPGVVALGFLGLALAVAGQLDQAVEPARQALALARDSGHPLSLAAGLHLSCLVHQQLGQAELVAAYAAEELDIARKHVLPFWIAGGLFFSGWALARQGQVQEGVQQMRRGIETHQATGACLGLPAYLADLAAACIITGDLDQAADAIDRGLSLVGAHGETSYAGELHRIQGDLLLERGGGTAAREAEAQYLEGYRIASRQSQGLYALRSVLSLATVWRRAGRSPAARDLLQSSTASFSDQTTTVPELVAARATLIDLAQGA